ncbi:ATP-binding protein [Desulfobulbus alkaliphilus]|uniref:ATP-binding protein n=1 Tax=Desulfobulbus alkaliphilus TaxID=869814 RepID=UPI00196508B2|nr:ATP-binding protein [Desulfobulbus alkaliphilus]MBM9536872.1 PAS domain S-box protein [Desulfobulbus alkaliphilus]
MFDWKKNSIAYRLTFQVILFSTMMALLVTIFQLYLDYRQEIQGIEKFFVSIAETSIRPLEESVWILDDLQVNLQIEGLTKRQDIVYAAVEMDNQIAWSKGTPVVKNSIGYTFPLLYQVRGDLKEIGLLHVVASLEGIHARLLRRVITLVSTNTLKTFLVSGFILFLFHRNITRHLIGLSEHVQGIDIRQKQPDAIVLERRRHRGPDELDQVTEVLNALCQGGYRAYADLHAQEQRLRLFLDATEEAVFGVDAEGRCTFINGKGLDYLLMHDRKSLLGHNILAMLTQHQRDTLQPCIFSEQIRKTIAAQEVLLTDEAVLYRADGSLLLVSLRSYPVLELGLCTGAVVFFTDLSRQQKLEQEKKLFTKVIRQAPALILILDAEGLIKYVNAGFQQIIGTDSQFLVGKPVLECFQDQNLINQVDEVGQVILSGGTWIGTLSLAGASGRPIDLDATVFPILNQFGQRTNVVAMARDITRERLLTEQLHHAQKMEAIGKLAASIAHEFGNPLLGIRFAIRDIQQRQGLDANDKKLLQLAENECDRMRKLIRDLQCFNRPSTGLKTRIDLHRALKDILLLHRNMLKKEKIRVVQEFAPQPLFVHGVEDQLRQVFINLILNAHDALVTQGGGVMTVTTAQETEVWIRIGDNGPGIDPENFDRIFEPFFSTKSAVEGIGLGLPVSYGIIRAHGGTIEVESTPGQTTFSVRLPVNTNSAGSPPFFPDTDRPAA